MARFVLGLLWSAGILVVGIDGAALLHRRAEEPAEKDSEQHIPPYREDGQLQFLPKDGSKEVSISIEVPVSFSKFMEGLMWRKELSDKQGMIFQWNEDAPRAFWMENTYIGLDIVYVTSDKRIVSIKKAQPLSRASVPSDNDGIMMDASYAVEVPAGWCERHGISVGDSVKFEITSPHFFVAQDKPAFGATEEEVRQAEDDGNYQPVLLTIM